MSQTPPPDELDNLLEAITNYGRIQAGQIVAQLEHPGEYIAITPEKAKAAIHAYCLAVEKKARLNELRRLDAADDNLVFLTTDGLNYLMTRSEEIRKELS